MTPFIAHSITPDGRKIDALIMSDATAEQTRDVYEAALQEEFPGAVIVSFHEAHEHGKPERPEPREPRAIEEMVMYGWAGMVAILTFLHWLNRNRK